MCNEYPGPRCSNHGLHWLQTAEKEFLVAKKQHEPDSLPYITAMQNLKQAQHDYNTTPDGIENAQQRAQNNPSNTKLQEAHSYYQRVRVQQIEALAEQRNGRAANIASLTQAAQTFYSTEEIESVLSSIRRNNERAGQINKWDPLDVETATVRYLATLNRIENNITKQQPITVEQQQLFQTLREMPAPTHPVTLKTYAELPQALPRSKAALRNELYAVAYIQKVPFPIAQAYYDAYRKQYMDEFAHLERKSERPDPPKEWISGNYPNTGYQNSASSAFAPSDDASMYAMYRLRVDETAIPDYLKTSQVYAALNLSGDPQNTSDAEPSLLFYNHKGKQLGVYKMTPPTLQAAAPEIANHLQGKTIITHNLHQETAWLKDNLTQYNLPQAPVLNLTEMSSKYLNLPQQNLKLICEKVGVDYNTKTLDETTDTIMKAFIHTKKKAHSQWSMKTSRKNAPALQEVPLSARW